MIFNRWTFFIWTGVAIELALLVTLHKHHATTAAPFAPAQSPAVAGGPQRTTAKRDPRPDPLPPDQKDEPRAPRGPAPGSVGDVLNRALASPDFIRTLGAAQKVAIELHYRSLLEKLGLSPAPLEQFVRLLAEKQLAKTRAESQAMAAGAFGSGRVIDAIAEAQAPVNLQIEQLLGAEKYAAYHEFEMAEGIRATLKRWQNGLNGRGAAVGNDELEAAVALLQAAVPVDERGGITRFTGMSVEVATGLVPQRYTSPLPLNAIELLRGRFSDIQLRQLGALMLQQEDELRFRRLVLDRPR